MHDENDFAVFLTNRMTVQSDAIKKHPYWSPLIDNASKQIYEFDAETSISLDFKESYSPDLHRFIKLCIPFFELNHAIEGKQDLVAESLSAASMFLWCQVWRPLDDILDKEGSLHSNLKALIQSFSRAQHFMYSRNLIASSENFSLCEQLFSNIDVEHDISKRSHYNYIFHRAAVFTTAVVAMKYDPKSLNAYREYINIIGFLYDFIDFIHDLEMKSATPVTKMWEDLGDKYSLSNKKMQSFTKNCDSLITKKIEIFRSQFSSPTPITLQCIDDAYIWAFT